MTRQLVPSRRPFENLAEMKAVDCTGDCHREKPGTAEQRPEKKLPIVDSLPTGNSQKDNGFRKRDKVGCADPRPSPMERLVGAQKFANTRVVLLWGVDCPNDFLVPLQESLSVHLRDEIQ